MHWVIIEEEKHDRREDIMIRKHMKKEEKHAIQNNTREGYNINAYLKYNVKFCNKNFIK